MLSAEYEKEQDELERALASDQASLDQFNDCLLYTSRCV